MQPLLRAGIDPEQLLLRVLETAMRTAVGGAAVSVIVLPGDVALKPAPEGARVGCAQPPLMPFRRRG